LTALSPRFHNGNHLGGLLRKATRTSCHRGIDGVDMNADRRLSVCHAPCWTVAFLIALTFLLPPAVAEIPAGPEVATSRDYAKLEEQFLTRLMLEPYQAKHAEGQAAATDKDPGEEFLRLWMDSATKGFDKADFAPLLDQGKKAVEGGCDDPLFAYCYGRVIGIQGETEQSAKYLKQALDNVEASGYDVCFGSWAAKNLSIALRQLKRNDEAKEVVKRGVECLTKTVTDGPYHPDEQRMLYQHMLWCLDNYSIEQVEGIVEAINTHLYPWLSHMSHGHLEIRKAWKARGGGWAAEVTKEGWKGFEKHMVAGRDHLTEAWNLNPEWPESATQMIKVAMGGHASAEETPRFWFDRAVAAQFDYSPAYEALMWSLLPRWGGSHQELYVLGRECLETARFDTQVPFAYLQAFEYILRDYGSTLDYFKIPGVFEDLQALADGYLGEPSMQPHHDWYRSFKVAVAVRCNQWEDARSFLDKLEGAPDENAFARTGLKSADTIGEIYARSGELAAQTAEAEQLAADGKFDEAKSKYEELASKSTDHQQVTTFYRGRLRGVEFDGNFSKGEWSTIPIDAQLTGWRIVGGKWSVDDEGRLIGEPQTNGLGLVYEKVLGTRFELRGKVVFVKHPYTQTNIGIYFGQKTGAMSNSFRIFLDDDYAAVLKDEDQLQTGEVNVKYANILRVERWDSKISAYINDERVASGVQIESEGEPETETIALGGKYWYAGPVIRFENLEVRKLDQPPADLAVDTEATEPADKPEAAETDDEVPSL
jgi:hypothetical protein